MIKTICFLILNIRLLDLALIVEILLNFLSCALANMHLTVHLHAKLRINFLIEIVALMMLNQKNKKKQ